ncbi:hypothetical protein CAEBREN_01375 [Caenorhabditis brenneri]|uniref:Mos1 transposase HTH domain-containing protein n=1 Tax=Caenorhabditis brenneri TaxID=135651 RepID=G0NN09_CAEBE|nr:hypothetical protein CAEBREN_01375 [Caenorhabditis brenneri]
MAHVLLSCPIVLRQCILYECVGRAPIFEAYRKLCARLGSNFMSYQEFEFWFMRFSRKEYDLNYDRSFVLQKVSKSLRQLLATRNPGFLELTVFNLDTICKLQYDDTSIVYCGPELWNDEESKEPRESINLVNVERQDLCDDRMKKEVKIKGDVFKIASHDFSMILGNNRLSLETFTFGHMPPVFIDFILQIFMKRNQRIRTKKLKLFIHDLKNLEFLHFFVVEEEVILAFSRNWDTLPMDVIINHPEIKNAEMVRVKMPVSTFPPDSILRLPRITVVIYPDELEKVEVVEKFRMVSFEFLLLIKC